MTKTTRDEIDIDLDGTIDHAIKELQRLKKLYPKGRIGLETEHSYGESYPRLRLSFTRQKEPVEIEYDKLAAKRARLADLRAGAQVFAKEGAPYPRAKELEKLEVELGELSNPRAALVIMNGEIVAFDWIANYMNASLMATGMMEALASDTDRSGEADETAQQAQP